MTTIVHKIYALNRGILADEMSFRSDTEFYLKGGKQFQNVDILPHGPARRMNGFGFLGTNFDSRSKGFSHKINEQLQFSQIFSEGQIDIYRNGVFVTRLSDGLARIDSLSINSAGSGYAVDEELTFTGGGGSGAVATITSIGGSGEITGVTLNHPGYDFTSAPTVDVDTVSGTGADLTATLTSVYEIPYLWADIETLKFTTSAETRYIFHRSYKRRELKRQSDDNIWDISIGVDEPEAGYRFIDTKGIKLKTNTATVGTGRTLTSDTALFDSGWVGRWIYLRDGYGKITGFTNSTTVTWQIYREITGGDHATFSVDWQESIESEERGYAGAGLLLQDRFWIAGFSSAPGTIAASTVGDYVNFDDVDPDIDSSAFVVTANSADSELIQSLVAGTGSLQAFQDGAEISIYGDPAITPSTVIVEQQTTVGSLPIQPIPVDQETYFVSRSGDQLMSFLLRDQYDSYITNNYTILSGGIISNPVQMTFLRSWLNTQANYVYIVNDDGTIAVLGVSAEQEILGFFKIIPEGTDKFKSAWVHTVNNEDGTTEDRLFVLVDRENGVNLEVMSATQLSNNAYVHLNSWCNATSVSATTTFSGLTSLADQTVSVLASDGRDLGDYVVDSVGGLVIDTEETDIYVGLPYTSIIETMNIDIPVETGSVRGRNMKIQRVQLDVQDTQYFQVMEGNREDGLIDVSFRRYGESLLGEPLTMKTGLTEDLFIDVYADEVDAAGAQLTILIKSDRPLPFQINGIIIWLEI